MNLDKKFITIKSPGQKHQIFSMKNKIFLSASIESYKGDIYYPYKIFSKLNYIPLFDNINDLKKTFLNKIYYINQNLLKNDKLPNNINNKIINNIINNNHIKVIRKKNKIKTNITNTKFKWGINDIIEINFTNLNKSIFFSNKYEDYNLKIFYIIDSKNNTLFLTNKNIEKMILCNTNTITNDYIYQIKQNNKIELDFFKKLKLIKQKNKFDHILYINTNITIYRRFFNHIELIYSNNYIENINIFNISNKNNKFIMVPLIHNNSIHNIYIKKITFHINHNYINKFDDIKYFNVEYLDLTKKDYLFKNSTEFRNFLKQSNNIDGTFKDLHIFDSKKNYINIFRIIIVYFIYQFAIKYYTSKDGDIFDLYY